MNIVVVRRGLLGDTIVAYRAFEALRRRYQGANISLVAESEQESGICWAKELLEGSSLVDEVIPFTGYNTKDVLRKSRALLGLYNFLLKRRPQLGVILMTPEHTTWEPILMKLARVKEIVEADPKNPIYMRSKGSGKKIEHISEQLIRVLIGNIESDGVATTTTTIVPRIDNLGLARHAIHDWITRNRMRSPLFALAPWSNMPVKEWPIESFQKVCIEVKKQFNGTFVVFGGKRDRERSERFASSIGGVTVAGIFNVRESLALLEHCSIYFGNDTGTMHMADLMGVPCVAIFSDRDARGLWEPRGKDHKILRLSVPCGGCMLRECETQKMKCIRGITIQDVHQAVTTVLSAKIPKE